MRHAGAAQARVHPSGRFASAMQRADAVATRVAAIPNLTARLLVASTTLAALCIALGRGIFGEGHQHEFFRDLGPASLATSVLTLMVAVFGLVIARREAHSHDWHDVNNFWFLSGLGFLYLTVDAPLDLHGRIGEGLAVITGHQSLPGIHRMSDAVLLAYAAVGLLFVVLHVSDVRASWRATTYLGIGAAATLVMLAIDASGGPRPWLVVAEESVELAAASFFVGAYAARHRLLD
ncbi:MAG: hypothetical protein ACKVVT_09550 [Dehalococcoidia bacterium]